MKILIGIIFFHLLVILRSHAAEGDRPPWVSTALLSALLTGFVVYMLFSMDEPTI